MPDSLTTLIARVQAQLSDDGTQFSTANCTAAIRQALTQFNQAAPIHAGTLIDAIADQYEYALDGADFAGLLDIYGVFYNVTGIEGQAVQVEVKVYWLDNVPNVRLVTPLPAGAAVIDVLFSQPHTVQGLDSAAESTLSADQDQVLVDGACAGACFARAADRTETVNLNQGVPAEWRNTGNNFQIAFNLGLIRYQRRALPAPASFDSPRAWNDGFHSWPQ